LLRPTGCHHAGFQVYAEVGDDPYGRSLKQYGIIAMFILLGLPPVLLPDNILSEYRYRECLPLLKQSIWKMIRIDSHLMRIMPEIAPLKKAISQQV
jgi:hypothetical protein